MKNAPIAVLVLGLAILPGLLAAEPAAPEKPRLAVADFKVFGNMGVPDAGKSIAELLLPEFKGDKYQLVERNQLEAILNEQGLRMADIVEKPSLAQEKKIKGVRYLVVGTVVKFGDLAVSARIVDVTQNPGDIVESAKVSADDAKALKNALGHLARSLQGLRGSGKGPPNEITLDLGGGNVTLKLVLIPAGKFVMGSPEYEKGHSYSEYPQREVTISKPFFMGIYEVTQEQWEAMMGGHLNVFKGAKNPVEQVTRGDALQFCRKVSAKTGRTVRLPSEAEWEYACRAGSTTRFCFGDDEKGLGGYAWYDSNSDRKTHPVGQKKPNDFGLYDMHGNVGEWCSDWYGPYPRVTRVDPMGPDSGRYRVIRGGHWGNPASSSRSACRASAGPDYYNGNHGFRVVVESDED